MKRNLPGLEPTIFAFGRLASKLWELSEKLVENFFPVSQKLVWSKKWIHPGPRFFWNYENLETEFARAGALIFRVGKPSFQSPWADKKARREFLSHLQILIFVDVNRRFVSTEYWKILSRNRVLHVLNDKIAFVSPLNIAANLDGIALSDSFFLFVSWLCMHKDHIYKCPVKSRT